ncbi:alanine racemase [Rhodoblastus acidophilus]|uniref:alanine racemase n=1 Tax=Rhodoblastus acidophilus TaxID=1074 RepID=UPI002224269D|nr:alanine racemase [Rhodoblastus acidophilus]MCW2282880.1 alanine racemase [Rhodoblastus acidophilus]MCW2331741.1 alanine racemase [Rhodoblastus acidophilus]
MPEPALPADPCKDREKSQACLTIDLDALADNWRLLKARARGAECAAVVKADAYGIGIGPAARKLAAAGCKTFFVAHLAEAEILRKVAPEARIFALNGLPPGASSLFARNNLLPVLGSLPELEEWVAFCRADGQKHPAALHIDTGMNRLGLTPPDFPRALDLIEQFTPALIMTHFVSAEDHSAPRNRAQIERFERACAVFPPMRASLCNSSGLFLEEAPVFDLTRPGYALYGGNPTPGSDNPMKKVVSLDALILQVRDIRAGETAGYNARWTAHARRRLATIGLGYADGFPRSASCGAVGAEVFAGGVYCPVVGRISMDLSIVDITDAAPLKRGDRVEVLGDNISVDDLGAWAGTIGYEVLTNLGRRYRRVYVGEA